MANHQVVDKTLQGTRIITRHGEEYGDKVHVAEVVPTEFFHLSAFYPVLFAGSPDARGYNLVAVLGMEPGENLFLEGNNWDAGYIPLSIRRQPFLLQSQTIKEEDGTTATVPILAIDMDSPRVSKTDGEAMFTEEGEATEWFKAMNNRMAQLLRGSELGREFIRKLDVMELIEPLQMAVRLGDGSARRFEGLHTISETRLRELSEQDVLELHKLGYLDYIYSMRVSVAQFGALAKRKSARPKG
jgi:hypothetical protein